MLGNENNISVTTGGGNNNSYTSTVNGDTNTQNISMTTGGGNTATTTQTGDKNTVSLVSVGATNVPELIV